MITDLPMPTMDGISAVVYLRNRYKTLELIFITAESTVGLNETSAADTEEKFQKLDQIAKRVRNLETAPDKINSMLVGCEKLGLSAKVTAVHYGARGFIRKPFSPKKLAEALTQFKDTNDFIDSGIISKM